MGLDLYVSNGNVSRARWSYSGFALFRRKLALALGIELQSCVRDHNWSPVDLRTGKRILWGQLGPMAEFLHHSDCDGELTPKQCARIAPVLRTLLQALSTATPEGYADYDLEEGAKLAKAMLECARRGKPLTFS